MTRILWLSNTPSGAIEKLSPNTVAGGWMQSLEEQLVEDKNIELYVAFYYNHPIEPFKHKKTQYYPVLRSNTGSKFSRLIRRMPFGKNDDETELQKVLEIIEEVKPDIIHVHGTEENWGLIQKYTKIPVIVSIQGILSPYTERFFSGIPKRVAFINEGIKQKLLFKSANLSYSQMKKNAIREQEILKISKNIMGRTDWDRRITRVLAPDSKYFVGNEMLRPVFYEGKWNRKEYGKLIKIVSTSTAGIYKGLETIVKTAAILQKSSSFTFEWIVIGQNETGPLAQMVKKWLKCDYGQLGIRFVGIKKAEEMVDILISSDVYCQVSHIENSPNSLCEAMMVGMPIIASFAGGTDSMLENSEEGILVQDGDPYSYAGAINELVNHFELAKQYALKAKIKAEDRHNKKKIVEALITTYTNISQ